MGRTGSGPLARPRHASRDPGLRFDSVKQLEIFLISAVVTILVIRTQPWLTNDPQLGRGDLHIAHLPGGGLFTLGAIAAMAARDREGSGFFGGYGSVG